jgi:translation initiation factor 1A
MGNYGEFEEVDTNSPVIIDESTANVPTRVRTPRRGEVIGIIVQRYGGNRMEVKSTDGKSRNCRVPGRFKRDLWLRPKDIVLIMPWPDDDSKGDIIFKYHGGAVSQLRKRGMLDSIKEEF